MEPKAKRMRKEWYVPASEMARNTFNPVRSIVDGMKLTPNPDKQMIALSIGDPTVFHNLPIPEELEDVVIQKIKSRKFNGYNPSIGYEESRQAVADYTSTNTVKYTAKDVILTSGCSMALDLCISVLANRGQNILVPRPGFSIYKTLAESQDISVKYYDLMPEKSWQVDIESLESAIDDHTAAIVINNPSNPCGSVFSRDHLLDILDTASRHKLPIISDEIYEHFVFSGNEYHSLGSLTTDVPVLSCSGLTKRFLVPGWRMGWIVVTDRNNVLTEVRKGLVSLTQRLLGPTSLIQASLPEILAETPQSFYSDTLAYVEDNANLFYKLISEIPGLRPVKPQGAMYMMIGIDVEKFPGIKNDVDFTEKLVEEQSVFCLPAKCFQYPNYFRIVLTIPKDKVVVACNRMREFCEVHYKMVNGHRFSEGCK